MNKLVVKEIKKNKSILCSNCGAKAEIRLFLKDDKEKYVHYLCGKHGEEFFKELMDDNKTTS